MFPQVHDVEFSASLAQIVDVAIPALVELKKAGKCRLGRFIKNICHSAKVYFEYM